MTDWKDRYRQYLKSKDWNRKRTAKLRKKPLCAVCGTTAGLQVHHLTYRRWVDVTSEDLRVLCGRCHTLVHEAIQGGALAYKPSDTNHRKWQLTLAAVRKALARPENRPWTEPAPEGFTVTLAWLQGFATAHGGWTREQAMALGVGWPLAKGWLRGLIGQRITDAQRRQFELLAQNEPMLWCGPRLDPEHRPFWG